MTGIRDFGGACPPTAGLLLAATAPARAGTTERVSISSTGEQGTRGSYFPALSADGRFVAFGSLATNLVPGDTNGKADVFARDRETGRTERVSISSTGEQGNHDSYFFPALSAGGRFVA